jgi:hypothetical protein
VLAFAAYVLPLIGGLVNRVTGKIEVEKNKLFIPFAAIASLAVLFIVITNISFITFALSPVYRDKIELAGV